MTGSATINSPTKPTESELLALAQTAALGGAVKDAALTAAKRGLPDSYAATVDFKVRIHGTVTKGIGTHGSSGHKPATCNLNNGSMISQLLIELGVTPAKVKSGLRRIVKKFGHATDLSKNPANAEILTAFNEAGDEVAQSLPPVPWSSSPTSGAVNTKVAVEIL